MLQELLSYLSFSWSLFLRLSAPFRAVVLYSLAPIIALARQAKAVSYGTVGLVWAFTPSVEVYTFFSTAMVIGLCTGTGLALFVHVFLPRERAIQDIQVPTTTPERMRKWARDKPERKRDLKFKTPRYLPDSPRRDTVGDWRARRLANKDFRDIMEEEEKAFESI